MQDFILTLLFNIQGIGAASGLAYHDGTLMLISDDSACLYTYEIGTKNLTKSPHSGKTLVENIPKKDKPDLECMAVADGHIYLFGSGSTAKRNKMFSAGSNGLPFIETDVSELYSQLRKAAGLTTDDFNLEGAVRLNGTWYFFQRGNGAAGRNGVFTVSGDVMGDDFEIAYKEIKLPDCNGIAATFTDAVAVGDKIYFLGTAENSNSVYHDGEILGSIIGILNPAALEVELTRKISDTHKFEGLTLFKQSDTEISFLLCEDNDTDAATSGIYELKLFR